MRLIVDPRGRVRAVYGEEIDLRTLGPPKIARASHVEPGPDGRWVADLSPVLGPVLGPFDRMTQTQLDREIAAATGDSLRTVHRLGFSVLPDDGADGEPGPLYLVVDCPRCRRPTLYPGRHVDGACPDAECPGCAAPFAFDPLDVYATTSRRR